MPITRPNRLWIFLAFLVSSEVRLASSSMAAEPAPDPAVLAAKIDEMFSERWRAEKVVPAPAADDAEFLRRVTLDLVGRIPRVSEARDFLADQSPDKRRRLVDDLLNDPAYVQHFTRVWRATLLSQASAQDLRVLTGHLETWLRRQVRENVPYDRWVREILTIPLGDRLASSSSSPEAPTPLAFYQANELKPENLASAASRVFLGVNLECAQCHDHPFAAWKQEQFWQFAGFFAGVQRLRPDNAMTAALEMTDRRELTIPGTERVVAARFLDGSTPAWSSAAQPRTALAAWITSADNPYFARATANRLWAHFLGRGIIDPLDELGGRVAASHPALLDELARQFVQSGFDVKFLIRAITASAAYQRTSRLTDPSQRNPAMFARVSTRGLTPEQLFDSLVVATGCQDEHRARFLAEFTRLDRPTETQTSILQALLMMNGRLTGEATSLAQSATLAAVAEAPFLDRTGKIETLFLATLSRLPSAAEADRMAKYVSQAHDARDGLADVFWALLNSAEFMLNH